MITIGILSDTHGWLDPALREPFQGAAVILHAGDIGNDEVLSGLREVAPVRAVRGNMDGGDLLDLPLTDMVEVAGKHLALLHIAGSPRHPHRAALELLQRESPDVIVVGHSHIPVVGRVRGALWINPGAAGRQGIHEQRFAARIHIDETGEISMDRIHLGPRSVRTQAG